MVWQVMVREVLVREVLELAQQQVMAQFPQHLAVAFHQCPSRRRVRQVFQRQHKFSLTKFQRRHLLPLLLLHQLRQLLQRQHQLLPSRQLLQHLHKLHRPQQLHPNKWCALHNRAPRRLLQIQLYVRLQF